MTAILWTRLAVVAAIVLTAACGENRCHPYLEASVEVKMRLTSTCRYSFARGTPEQRSMTVADLVGADDDVQCGTTTEINREYWTVEWNGDFAGDVGDVTLEIPSPHDPGCVVQYKGVVIAEAID